MGKLERITVTMSDEMAGELRAAVASGAYATTSEIVREALRGWSEDRARREASLAKLRAMIREADDGPSFSAEEVFAELRHMVSGGERSEET